jgi:hypothetical protein
MPTSTARSVRSSSQSIRSSAKVRARLSGLGAGHGGPPALHTLPRWVTCGSSLRGRPIENVMPPLHGPRSRSYVPGRLGSRKGPQLEVANGKGAS